MQHAGLQYGQGAANSHQSPPTFTDISQIGGGGNTTSSLRHYRKKDGQPNEKNNGGTDLTINSENNVARVPPHNHYPARPNEYYHRYHPQYGDFACAPPVKYSEIAEPHKEPHKDFMEMCGTMAQPHIKQNYDNLTRQQTYPMDTSGVHNQYLHKDPQVQFKGESHQYMPKDAGQYQQYAHLAKYNQCRKYITPPAENDFLAKLQRINPSMARNIMTDHHMREAQVTYPDHQNRLYQNQRYYPTPHIQNNTSYNYPMAQPYNYASCNYGSAGTTGTARYTNQHERSASPRRYPEIMNYSVQKPPNYPASYGPEYAQHYQHRRGVPQEYYPQPMRADTFNSHQVESETRTASTGGLRHFIENWAEEEVVPESTFKDRPTAEGNEQVFVINSADLTPHLEGVSLVPTENGQYIIKSGTLDNSVLRIKETTENNGECTVNVQIIEAAPKVDVPSTVISTTSTETSVIVNPGDKEVLLKDMPTIELDEEKKAKREETVAVPPEKSGEIAQENKAKPEETAKKIEETTKKDEETPKCEDVSSVPISSTTKRTQRIFSVDDIIGTTLGTTSTTNQRRSSLQLSISTCEEPLLKKPEEIEPKPQEDVNVAKEDDKEEEVQYRDAILIEDDSVILEIGGAVVQLTVNQINGNKVLSVASLSEPLLIDINGNHSELPLEDRREDGDSSGVAENEENCCQHEESEEITPIIEDINENIIESEETHEENNNIENSVEENAEKLEDIEETIENTEETGMEVSQSEIIIGEDLSGDSDVFLEDNSKIEEIEERADKEVVQVQTEEGIPVSLTEEIIEDTGDIEQELKESIDDISVSSSLEMKIDEETLEEINLCSKEVEKCVESDILHEIIEEISSRFDNEIEENLEASAEFQDTHTEHVEAVKKDEEKIIEQIEEGRPKETVSNERKSSSKRRKSEDYTEKKKETKSKHPLETDEEPNRNKSKNHSKRSKKTSESLEKEETKKKTGRNRTGSQENDRKRKESESSSSSQKKHEECATKKLDEKKSKEMKKSARKPSSSEENPKKSVETPKKIEDTPKKPAESPKKIEDKSKKVEENLQNPEPITGRNITTKAAKKLYDCKTSRIEETVKKIKERKTKHVSFSLDTDKTYEDRRKEDFGKQTVSKETEESKQTVVKINEESRQSVVKPTGFNKQTVVKATENIKQNVVKAIVENKQTAVKITEDKPTVVKVTEDKQTVVKTNEVRQTVVVKAPRKSAIIENTASKIEVKRKVRWERRISEDSRRKSDEDRTRRLSWAEYATRKKLPADVTSKPSVRDVTRSATKTPETPDELLEHVAVAIDTEIKKNYQKKIAENNNWEDEDEEPEQLKKPTIRNHEIIDINEFNIRPMSPPSCSAQLSESDSLETYREVVDSKLNSLDIKIPKIKPDAQQLMHLIEKFLHKKNLNSDELSKVRTIIEYKRRIEDNRMKKITSEDARINQLTTYSEEARLNHIAAYDARLKTNFAEEARIEPIVTYAEETRTNAYNESARFAYDDVRFGNNKMAASYTIGERENLKLHLKKVPKKRKRFRNLYVEDDDDDDDDDSHLLDNYSVHQRDTKLVFKRKSGLLPQPFVKLERSQAVDLLAKKRKLN